MMIFLEIDHGDELTDAFRDKSLDQKGANWLNLGITTLTQTLPSEQRLSKGAQNVLLYLSNFLINFFEKGTIYQKCPYLKLVQPCLNCSLTFASADATNYAQAQELFSCVTAKVRDALDVEHKILFDPNLTRSSLEELSTNDLSSVCLAIIKLIRTRIPGVIKRALKILIFLQKNGYLTSVESNKCAEQLNTVLPSIVFNDDLSYQKCIRRTLEMLLATRANRVDPATLARNSRKSKVRLTPGRLRIIHLADITTPRATLCRNFIDASELLLTSRGLEHKNGLEVILTQAKVCITKSATTPTLYLIFIQLLFDWGIKSITKQDKKDPIFEALFFNMTEADPKFRAHILCRWIEVLLTNQYQEHAQTHYAILNDPQRMGCPTKDFEESFQKITKLIKP